MKPKFQVFELRLDLTVPALYPRGTGRNEKLAHDLAQEFAKNNPEDSFVVLPVYRKSRK